MDDNDGIDSLMEDLNDLGITKIEVDIKYGIQHKLYKETDLLLAQDLIVDGNKKIRRIKGEAYTSLLDIEVVTQDEDRIYLKVISEDEPRNSIISDLPPLKLKGKKGKRPPSSYPMAGADVGKIPDIANHIELYYIKKGEDKKNALLNDMNVLTMNNYFSNYKNSKYSPVEYFYICINLTRLGGNTHTDMLIVNNAIVDGEADDELDFSNPFDEDSLPF